MQKVAEQILPQNCLKTKSALVPARLESGLPWRAAVTARVIGAALLTSERAIPRSDAAISLI